MKYQIIRKRLLVESLFMGGGLALGVGALFLLMSLHDEYQSDNLSLQTTMTQFNNEMASLNDKYTKIQKNHDVYEEAKRKNDSEELLTSDEKILKILRNYRSKFRLKIDLNMSASKKIDSPVYAKKSAVMTYNEVTLNIEAMTDQDIYHLINALQADFPGAVKVTSLTVTRESKVSKEALITIADKGHVTLVTAKLIFNWFGIEPVEAPESTEGKPNVR